MTARYSDLKKIKGRKNYYRNPISLKIHYKDESHKFSTFTTKIGKAVEYVKNRLAEELGPTGKRRALRKAAGVLNPLVFDLWKELLEVIAPDITDSTRLTYNKNWTHGMKGFWDGKCVADVTAENIIHYKLWYIETNPTRHATKTVIHFRKLVKFVHGQGLIPALPDMAPLDTLADIVERAARREKVGRVYTEAEIQALITACDKFERIDMGNRCRAVVLLGAHGGMRKNEALGLKPEGVNLDTRLIKVWSTKNDEWRDVPMTDDVHAALSLIPMDGAYLFPMDSDPLRPVSSQLFDKLWVRAKDLAKIKGRARFHDLRHTFATMTAEDGWPPIVACEVLDMSLEVYQEIYSHASPQKKADWINRTFNRGVKP